jgi:hypothetical protein
MRLLSSENGIEEWFEYDPINDTMNIQTRTDVTPILEAMNEKRKQELWTKEVKGDWVHFAKIPPAIEIELKQRGLDIHDKNCTKRLMQVIQSEYPYLLSHQGKRLA